jgi:hypothetical protein
MLKKGDTVVMHTCGEAEHYNGKLWVCRTDEQKLHKSHDYTVVWLEGFSGCFAAKYLQKVDTSSYESKIMGFESSLKDYKDENENYEKSTHIEDFLYEINVNEKGEIPCLIKANGIEHSFGITQKDASSFAHIFQMHKMN